MLNHTFLILGPDGDDGVPMHWDKTFWQWIESGAPNVDTLYTEKELDFPIGELPVGVVCVINRETGKQWTPSPLWVGFENKI